MSPTFRVACIATLLFLYALAAYLDAPLLTTPVDEARQCVPGDRHGSQHSNHPGATFPTETARGCHA
jgi:hypothetical protein